MDDAIAIGEFIDEALIRLLLGIYLDEAFAVVNEYAHLTGFYFVAYMDEDYLPIVIDRLHGIAQNVYSEIRSLRDLVLGKTDRLKSALVQKLACAG